MVSPEDELPAAVQYTIKLSSVSVGTTPAADATVGLTGANVCTKVADLSAACDNANLEDIAAFEGDIAAQFSFVTTTSRKLTVSNPEFEPAIQGAYADFSFDV